MGTSYRCLKLPTQPIMDRIRCVARGLKPELYDGCIGCMYTIPRKAITSDIEEIELPQPTISRKVKRIGKT